MCPCGTLGIRTNHVNVAIWISIICILKNTQWHTNQLKLCLIVALLIYLCIRFTYIYILGLVRDIFRASFLQPRMIGEWSFLTPTSPQGHTSGSPPSTRGLRQWARATPVAPLAIDHHIQETLTSLASSPDISLSASIELSNSYHGQSHFVSLHLWYCYIHFSFGFS
jgi:hypothetical protein